MVNLEVVQSLGTQLRLKNALSRILALGFLVLLLAEWGSHAAIYANASLGEGAAVYSNESGHEDPCKTIVRCSDGQRQNQQVLKLSHDVTQHNGFIPRLSDLRRAGPSCSDAVFFRTSLRTIFRPPDPPFHPPEVI